MAVRLRSDVVLLSFDSGCGMILVLGSQQVQSRSGEFVVFGGQPGQVHAWISASMKWSSASECFLETAGIVFVAGRESAPSCGLLFDTREHS